MTKQVQEAYIIAATRTPVGKAPRGMFRNTHPDDLARLGISWNGGRVVGLARGELLPIGVSVADLVVEGRR